MILNVRNRSTIAGLPADAVVEVPTMVDANGVHPLTTGHQPDLHQLGLMQQVKAVERHTIAAAMTGSTAEALQAFALHPLVDSVTVARELLAGYIGGQSRPRQGVGETFTGSMTPIVEIVTDAAAAGEAVAAHAAR